MNVSSIGCRFCFAYQLQRTQVHAVSNERLPISLHRDVRCTATQQLSCCTPPAVLVVAAAIAAFLVIT